MNPFHMKRRVQFAETDVAGVLHFANYYRFMEEVEHAFWRSLGLSVMTQFEGRSISWPRVATSCEYHAPVAFEDEIDLALSVVDVGRCSITYQVAFTCDDRRVATGRIKAVCCGMTDGVFQAVAIPPPIRATLTEAAKMHRGT